MSLNTKRRCHMTLEIHLLDWDKLNIVARLNQLMKFQPSSFLWLDNSLSYDITKMNDKIDMDITRPLLFGQNRHN